MTTLDELGDRAALRGAVDQAGLGRDPRDAFHFPSFTVTTEDIDTRLTRIEDKLDLMLNWIHTRPDVK